MKQQKSTRTSIKASNKQAKLTHSPAFFPKNILALFSSLVFGNASERIIFPILALVFFDQHSSLLPANSDHIVRSYWYGLCIALPSIANFIAAPVLSCLSDRYGRKKLLLLSYVGTFIAGIITSIAILNQQVQLFALGMFLQGLFSRTNPIGQAVIGDTSCGQKKLINIGWVQTFIAFGAFIGPIIGGHYAHWRFDQLNFSMPFMLSALLSLAAALVCFFFFKETLEQPRKHLSLSLVFGSVLILKQKRTALLALILACEQFTWSFYYQYAPPAVKLISHFSAISLGLFVGLMAFWVMLGGAVGIRLLRKKYTTNQTLSIALAMQLLGGVSILLAFGFKLSWLVWLSSIPAACGDVIAFSVISTLYSNTFEKHQQGQVMGACFFNAAAIWSITGLLGGYLIAINNLLPLIIAPITVGIALFLHLYAYSFNQTRLN